MQIPPDFLATIDEAISHYPVSKRSATLPLLHLFQERFGYISDEAVLWIAAKLELEPISVLELVTFYPMFRRKPAGKHHIRVCRTLSCALAGSQELKAALGKAIGVENAHDHAEPISVSPDGRFSIEFVECLASCGSGPVIMVDDDLHERVSADQIPQILSQYP